MKQKFITHKQLFILCAIGVLIIIFSLYFIFFNYTPKEYDVLNINWGMSSEDVIKSEYENNNKYYSKDVNILSELIISYNVYIDGYQGNLDYYFIQNKLIKIIFCSKFFEEDSYNKALIKFTESLDNKYQYNLLLSDYDNLNDSEVNYKCWYNDTSEISLQYGKFSFDNYYSINIYFDSKSKIRDSIINNKPM